MVEADSRDQPWHRRIVGGLWEEMGRLQFDFLVERGLEPIHFLLDVGCGSLRAGVHLVPYLQPGHYFGIDRNQRLLEAGLKELAETTRRPTLVAMDDFSFDSMGARFDYVWAQSLFTHLPLDLIHRCLHNAAEVMNPGAHFYATFFEYPGAIREPFLRHDRDSYRYDFRAFERLVKGLPLEVAYIGEWGHPRGQLMLAFTLA